MALNSRFSCLHHYRLHLFAVLESPSEGLGQFEPNAFLSTRQALYKLSYTPSLPCLCFGRMSSKGISQPLLPKSLAGWDSGHDGHQVLGPSCCLALPGWALLKDGKLQGFTPERGGMDSQGVDGNTTLGCPGIYSALPRLWPQPIREGFNFAHPPTL